MSDEERKQDSESSADAQNQAPETSTNAEANSADVKPAAEKPAAEKPAEEAKADHADKPTEAPASDAKPAADAPKADAPKADAPKADDAAAEKPAAKAAATDAPKADDAAADKPKVKPAPAAKAAADGAPAKKAPPKKEAPPPDPRTIAAKELAEQIQTTISASLGQDVVEEAGAAQYKSMLRIRKDRWLETFELLKKHEAWRFDYIEMMAGTDYKDYIEVVVYIHSTELGHEVLLKTRTDRENAEVPSIVSVHPGVNWEEREIYDLVGVTFTNHPDLRRIMMWEGFQGHPLRKDYTPWEGEEDPDVAE